MLIRTVADLFAATEFERYALESADPPQTSNACLDLRQPDAAFRIHAVSVVALGQSEIDAAVLRFRPLLFGTAWKCLDLALELGLHQAGIPPHNQRIQEYSIKQKGDRAADAVLPPLSADPLVWDRLVELYRATIEVRHCLVHRTLQLNSRGDMTHMRDRNGQPIPDFTTSGQDAFAQAARHALQAVFNCGNDARTRALLVYQLDRVNAIHGLGVLGGGAHRPVEHQVRISAAIQPDGRWVVDIDAARAGFLSAWPNMPANLLVTPVGADNALPLVGRLEEAEGGSAVIIDPLAPPQWMRP